MPASPACSETRAAATALLAEALDTLAALGVDVMIDGDPPQYWIVGVQRSEGEVIALASKMASLLSKRMR